MKWVIGIVILAIASFGGWLIYQEWLSVSTKKKPVEAVAPAINGSQLPGMDWALESILADAQRRGASGMKDFLKRYGKKVQDPRLAWIELDYVVLVSREDIVEARLTFNKVKERVTAESPVYPRVQQLADTYK